MVNDSTTAGNGVVGNDRPSTLCAEWVRTQKNCHEFNDVVRANGERADLLAALKAAEQFLAPEIDRGPAVNGWKNTVSMVKAAIAAAEGL